MKSERELQVIEAAYNVFIRYGFARTTMGDLAKEAGLSRPALYLVYPGKAEVFQAVIEWMVDRILETIATTLNEDWPLERKLTHVFEVSISELYDEIKAHPDAQDLLSPDTHVMPGVEQAYSRLQGYLAELLEKPVKAAGIKATASELARMLMAATKGFKVVATDGKDFRRLIALQVTLVTQTLGQTRSRRAANA